MEVAQAGLELMTLHLLSAEITGVRNRDVLVSAVSQPRLSYVLGKRLIN